MTTLAQLEQKHYSYNRWINEWKFLYEAYQGGRQWQLSGYLTRYLFESDEEYQERVMQTPYDNHCRGVVHLYNSFLFSSAVNRDLAGLEDDPNMVDFLEDADLDGRSMDQFMRDVDIMSSVFGSAWIVIDKPRVTVNTVADEIGLSVRPYLTLFNPTQIWDWRFDRQINGRYELGYVKLVEEESQDHLVIKEFFPEQVLTWRVDRVKKGVELLDSVPQPLGRIPIVITYNERTDVRGIGLSEISDIARMNRSLYDETSELTQIIRLSNHPSLVKTASTQAAAGAGAIIQLPEDLPGELKPYLLQPNAASLDGVRNSIQDKVEAINRMAAVGSVRGVETRQMSGVAIETEMRTLNARLAVKADTLELCEEHLFEMWCLWQGLEWAGVISYSDSYNARDRNHDLAVLKAASELVPNDPALQKQIRLQVAEIIVDDPETLSNILGEIDSVETQLQPVEVDADMIHPSLVGATTAEKNDHIQKMLMEGLSNAEILALHPELSLADIVAAGAAAARSN